MFFLININDSHALLIKTIERSLFNSLIMSDDMESDYEYNDSDFILRPSTNQFQVQPLQPVENINVFWQEFYNRVCYQRKMWEKNGIRSRVKDKSLWSSSTEPIKLLNFGFQNESSSSNNLTITVKRLKGFVEVWLQTVWVNPKKNFGISGTFIISHLFWYEIILFITLSSPY